MKRSAYFIFFCLFTFIGCDDVVVVENSAPTVELVSACRTDGHVFFNLKVRDIEDDPVDVAVVVQGVPSNEGIEGNGSPVGVVGAGLGGSGWVGLSSADPNLVHRVEWLQCTAAEDCLLPDSITDLADTSNCLCIAQDNMFHVLQSVTIEARDHDGEYFSKTFQDFEIVDGCTP